MSKTKVKKLNTEAEFRVPYEKLDENIVNLVKVINSFDDVYTIGSCGGHKNPKSYQLADGHWNVIFRVKQSSEGWISLEFLTWLVNNDLVRGGFEIRLIALAPPPFINGELGSCIYFVLEGYKTPPDEIADLMTEAKEELYKQSIWSLDS